MEDSVIINYDFQGWPVVKMSLRDILEQLRKSGVFAYDVDSATYFIRDDSPVLDIYPTVLEDDGMGYGINERFITEFTRVPVELGGERLNVFIEKDCLNHDIDDDK